VHHRSVFLSGLFFLGSLACGGSVYQPSRVAHFDPDGAAEVDDEDVRKAFEAKSQLGDAINVAYFTFDPSKEADIEKAIRSVSGVSTVYSIPALAVTGQHRFEETSGWQAPAPAPLSVKKLRLLAARAHCDVLVVVDYSRRTDVSVNGFAAFNVLLLPALFLPFRDVKVESAVDAFVIDTRNGYMYGHVALSKEARAPRETIYANDDELVASEWKALQGELEGALVKLVDSERQHPAAVAHP
jgi:hypothetical protein